MPPPRGPATCELPQVYGLISCKPGQTVGNFASLKNQPGAAPQSKTSSPSPLQPRPSITSLRTPPLLECLPRCHLKMTKPLFFIIFELRPSMDLASIWLSHLYSNETTRFSNFDIERLVILPWATYYLGATYKQGPLRLTFGGGRPCQQ